MNQVLRGGGGRLVVVFFLLCSSSKFCYNVIADSVKSYDEINNDGIAWSWTLLSTSPCFANGGNMNAFDIQTSVLFTSKSNQTYTYRLTSNYGEFVEPPRDITLDPNGQISFPYTYNNPGIYTNEFTTQVLNTDRSGSISFNSPWTIQDDGTCINTEPTTPSPTPASNPTEVSDPLLGDSNSGGTTMMRMMMTTTTTNTVTMILVGGLLLTQYIMF